MITTRYRQNFWRKSGKLGCNGVYIYKSNIKGAGDGIFTSKYIPKGVLVTEYVGYKRRIRYRKRKGGDSCKYHYELSGDSRVLVGIRKHSKLIGRGIAQLANDAICQHLSGLNNNCGFCEVEGRVFIRALRNILPGEELLVDYGLQYWITEIIKNSHFYGSDYQTWVDMIAKTCNVWYQYRKMRVYKVKDTTRNTSSTKMTLVLDRAIDICCKKKECVNIVIIPRCFTSVIYIYCESCDSMINIGEICCSDR